MNCLTGNTLRLSAVFKDFNGDVVMPDSVICRIYDAQRSKIAEYHPILIDGEYVCYHTPETSGAFYVEFYGTVGTLPILNRQKNEANFI
jgi:hypothetical protein